jgi:hypothetical protein
MPAEQQYPDLVAQYEKKPPAPPPDLEIPQPIASVRTPPAAKQGKAFDPTPDSKYPNLVKQYETRRAMGPWGGLVKESHRPPFMMYGVSGYTYEKVQAARSKADAVARGQVKYTPEEQQILNAAEKSDAAYMTGLSVANKYAVEPFEKMSSAGREWAAKDLEKHFFDSTGVKQMRVEAGKMSKEEYERELEEWRKDHPRLAGIVRSIGGTVGGVAADPRMWPFFFEAAGETAAKEAGGSFFSRAVSPGLKKATGIGFTGQMAYGTVRGASEIPGVMSRKDIPEYQKYEAIADVVVSGVMTAWGARHTFSNGEKLPAPLPRDIVKELNNLSEADRQKIFARVAEKLGRQVGGLVKPPEAPPADFRVPGEMEPEPSNLPFTVEDKRGQDAEEGIGVQIIDAPVLNPEERMFRRQDEREQETRALLEQERVQRERDVVGKVQKYKDQVQEQLERERALEDKDKRRVAPAGLVDLRERMENIANENMYESAADMARSLLEKKPRGVELKPFEKDFLKLWEERKRVVSGVSGAEDAKRTKFGEKEARVEGERIEREQKLREASVRLNEQASEAKTPEEVQEKAEQADEALRRAEELRTETDRARSEREAARESEQHFPAGAPINRYSEGRSTEVRLPDGRKLPAHYAVVKEADIITSHDAHSFEWNKKFQPAKMQPRDYSTNKEARHGVIAGGQDFDLNSYFNTDNTGHNGPSIIFADGRVPGGNGRAMRLSRAYRTMDPEAIRAHLVENAQQFGIDPSKIPPAEDHPFLVRVLDDTPEDLQTLIDIGQDLNRDETRGFSTAEQAVMSADRLSTDTLEWVSRRLDDMGEDASIRELVRHRGLELFQKLVNDGVISPTKRAEFLTSKGELTERAKDMFENAMLGKVINDADLISTMPKHIRDKLFRSLAPLAKIKAGDAAWDFTDYLEEAVRHWKRIEALTETLDVYKGSRSEQYMTFQNGKMIKEPIHPAVEALIRFLDKKPLEIKDGFYKYIDDYEGRQTTLMGVEPPNPRTAFNKNVAEKVGVEVAQGEWGTIKPALAEPPKPAEEKPKAAAQEEVPADEDIDLTDASDEDLQFDIQSAIELYGENDPITQAYIKEWERRQKKAGVPPDFNYPSSFGADELPLEATPAEKQAEHEAKASLETVTHDVDLARELSTSGPMDEAKLRDILSRHPRYSAGKVNAVVTVMKNFAEKYLRMPFDDWLRQKVAEVKVGGTGASAHVAEKSPQDVLMQGVPYGAGMSTDQFISWAKAAGAKLQIEDLGLAQPKLFGGADRVYRLRNTQGTVVLVNEAQMEHLRGEVPELRRKITTGGDLAQPGLFAMEPTPDEAKPQGSLFGMEPTPEQAQLAMEPTPESKKTDTLFQHGPEMASVEELSRGETFWRVKKNGQLSYQGIQPDANLQDGEALIAVKRDGSMRVQDQRTGLGDAGTLDKVRAKIVSALSDQAKSDTFYQNNKGAVEFLNDGRAIIHLMENADVSTIMHEFAHVARRNLKPDDAAIVHDWLKIKDGAWHVADEEKFARAFEKYLYDGEAPTQGLKAVFARIRDWMIEVYQAVKGSAINIRFPEEVRKVFDRMVAGVPEDLEELPEKPVSRSKLSSAIDDEARRMQRVQEDKGDLVTPEERVGATKIAEGGEALTDSMTEARMRVFADQEQAIQWAKENKDKLRGVQLFTLQDGRGFAHFLPKDPSILFQDVDPEEIDRRIRMIDERMQRIIPDAERARLGKMRQDLVAQKAKQSLAFTPPPGESTGKTIKLWTPEGEREISDVPRKPDSERGVSDAPVQLQEPRGAEPVPERAGRSGSAEPSGTPGRDLRGPAARRGGKRATGRPREALRDVQAAQLDAPVHDRGTALYTQEAWESKLEDSMLPPNVPVPTVRIPEPIIRMLPYPGQPEVVESALSGLKQHDAYIIATTQGTGKTYTGSAIISQLYRPGMKVLVLTVSKDLIHQRRNGWIAVARDFDVDLNELPTGVSDPEPGIYAATYATAIGRDGIQNVKWDLVVADEIGEARKWYSSQRGAMMKTLATNAKKVLYMSATPFHTALELGHMDKLGLWKDTGFAAWGRHFGVYKDTEGNWAGGNAPKKLLRLREQLIERGQFINQDTNLEGFNVSFAQVPLSPEELQAVKNISEAFRLAEDYFKRRGRKSMIRPTRGNVVTYTKKYLERSRLPQAIELAKKAEKEGWKVGIFSETKSGRSEVFDFLKEADEGLDGRISELLPPLPDVPESLEAEFGPDLANYSGPHSASRTAEKEAFLDDSKKHIYVSYAAGGIGVSLHDTVGTKPRMVIYLGPPYSGMMFDQAIKRFWRYGTKSDVHAVFMVSNSRPELNMIVGKVAPRMTSLRALVSGIDEQDKFVNTLRNMDSEHEKQAAYELGQNMKFDADDFTKTETTHAVQSWKDVKIGSAETAKNKGMRMPKPGGHPGVIRLFQDEYEPPEDFELPEEMEAQNENQEQQAAFENERAPGDVPAPHRAMLGDAIGLEALADTRDAPESPVGAVRLRWDTGKRYVETAWDSVEGTRPIRASKVIRLYNFTNGRKLIREVGGRPGQKIAYDIAEYHIESGNIGGPWKVRYQEILRDNGINTKNRVTFMDPKTGQRHEVNEHHNLVMAKEGKQPPANPRVARAVQQLTELMNDVRAQLGKMGAAVEVFDEGSGQKRYVPYSELADDPHYWPHILDPDYEIKMTDPVTGHEETVTLRDWLNGEPGEARFERITRHIMDKYGWSRARAEDFLASRRRDVPLVGNVERAREYDLPFYKTGPDAMFDYLEGVAEAAARTKVFGQRRQKLERLISMIPEQANRARVREVMDSLLSNRQYEDETRALVSFAADWAVLTKMTFSGLKVLGHAVHSAVILDTKSFLRSILRTAIHRKDAVAHAAFAGSLNEHYKIAIMKEFGIKGKGRLDRLAQKYLKIVGFTKGYDTGRVLADGAARIYMEKTALPKLMKGDTKRGFYRRNLKEVLHLSDEAIDGAIDRGRWAEEDFDRAGKAAADKVMFTGDPTELPPNWRARADEPGADNALAMLRVATLLKGYMFKTSALLRERLWDEAQKGNFRPWIPFLIMYPIIGEIIGNMSSLAHANKKRFDELMSDKESPEAMLLWRAAGDIGHATGTTILYNLLDETFRHHNVHYVFTTELPEFAAGPAYSDAWRTFRLPIQMLSEEDKKHGKTAAEKRYKDLLRWLGATVPATGGVIKLLSPEPKKTGHSKSDYHFTPMPVR